MSRRRGQVVTSIDRHRNGVRGEPFHVVLFTDDGAPMVGIVFDAEEGLCRTAVLNVEKLAAGDIAFGSNSWRGDEYEPMLAKAVAAWEDQRCLSTTDEEGSEHA